MQLFSFSLLIYLLPQSYHPIHSIPCVPNILVMGFKIFDKTTTTAQASPLINKYNTLYVRQTSELPRMEWQSTWTWTWIRFPGNCFSFRRRKEKFLLFFPLWVGLVWAVRFSSKGRLGIRWIYLLFCIYSLMRFGCPPSWALWCCADCRGFGINF